uniref:ATP synthase F0 subunit 8 n=1 Tax=Cyanea capillata TaxID=27804 RepID=G9ISG2_CYACP|nr:ATP synthase F0 subunit 8 [Cyanea capillata]
MPQLDFVIYFNQYIWLIAILSLCIIMMLKTILPNIKANLSSRVSVVIVEEKIKNHKEFIVFKKLLSV